MANRNVKAARIDQARRELDRLKTDFDAWIKTRHSRDKLKQYYSQLETLNQVLTDAWLRLNEEFQGIREDQPTDRVYSAVRDVDKGLIFVQRVWDYYRVRFDQRDDSDPILKQLLSAADDLIWSCYAEPFRNAKLDRKPVPLPYIEAKYSPAAILRTEPPPELQPDSALLQAYLREMPIPVVSLPPGCRKSPWWLAYLGHEVGHHVQNDLLEDPGLAETFRDLLIAAAQADPEPRCDEKTAEVWGGWADEIFADAFSICMMGEWAVWTIAELEVAERQTMIKRKPSYPAPITRLQLLASMATEMGRGNEALDILADFDLDPNRMLEPQPGDTDRIGGWRASTTLDLQMAPKIAKAIFSSTLCAGKRLDQLCGWSGNEFSPNGSVSKWADALREKSQKFPQKTLRSARMVASGSVAAWAEITRETAEAKRNEEEKKLALNVPKMIIDNREETTRSAERERTHKERAQELGERLVHIARQYAPGDNDEGT